MLNFLVLILTILTINPSLWATGMSQINTAVYDTCTIYRKTGTTEACDIKFRDNMRSTEDRCPSNRVFHRDYDSLFILGSISDDEPEKIDLHYSFGYTFGPTNNNTLASLNVMLDFLKQNGACKDVTKPISVNSIEIID